MAKHFLLLLGILTHFEVLLGQESKLPVVVEFSNNRFSSAEGSILSLSIKVQGAGISYRWVKKGGKQICSKDTCKLNTSGWGAGKHLLFAIASNDWGEAIIKYHITLHPRSFDLTPEEIEPKLLRSLDEVRYFAYEQQSIKTLKGQAFVFGSSEIEVIDSRKQLLTWNSRLVVPLSSLVLFGKEGTQEFLSIGGSHLGFVKQGNTNILLLEKGVLRSRNLEDFSEPNIIKVGKNLQIQASIPSDFLLKLEKNKGGVQQVDISVFKGSVEVVYMQNTQDPEPQEIMFLKQNLPQGTVMQGMLNEPNSFKSSVVADLDIEELFFLTTPYYQLNFDDPLEVDPKIFGRVSKRKRQSLKQAIQQSQESIENSDYLHALELLLPFNDELYDRYMLAYLLGKASKGLFLYEQAKMALEIAIELDQDRYEANYELATLHFLLEEWKQAEKLFAVTEVEKSKNRKVWNYYRAFTNYKLDSQSKASWYFNLSLWEEPNQEIDSSINEFLSQIESQSNFFGQIDLFILRDSNPFKLSQGRSNSQEGVGIGWQEAVTFDSSLAYKIFQDGFSNGKIMWKSTVRGHSDLILTRYLDQSLSIPIVFPAINDKSKKDKPLLYFGLEPLVGMQMISNLRLYDKIGMKWLVGSYSLGLHMDLSYFDIMHLDPEPNRLKPLDPVDWQENELLDLGLRKRGVLLSGEKSIGKLEGILSLSMSEYRYRFQGSGAKSFVSKVIAAKSSYNFSLRWIISAYLNIEMRDFLSQEIKRSDKIIGYGTNILWAWIPVMNLILGIDSRARESNLEQNNYQNWQYKSGISYKF